MDNARLTHRIVECTGMTNLVLWPGCGGRLRRVLSINVASQPAVIGAAVRQLCLTHNCPCTDVLLARYS